MGWNERVIQLLQQIAGVFVSITAVKLAQVATPGIIDLGVAKRLHGVQATMAAAGTYEVGYSDDGTATGYAALTGAAALASNSGPWDTTQPSPCACPLVAPAGKHLVIKTTGGGLNGVAFVS